MDFQKTALPGYRMPLCHVQTLEQTQDLRLSDSDGDIGHILGCWGQILLRSKEWMGDSVGVSGGVMAWVLYMPEEGTAPVRAETWIPFQMKWDMQDVRQDGDLLVCPVLKSIDARNVSARKMVIRANISVLAQAVEPIEALICQPESVPGDIYMKIDTHPMEIPCEAGEMAFQIDEDLPLPQGQPPVNKMIYYHLEPVITESRILADKLLFRGKLNLHLLYLSDSGNLHTWEGETGFSKYTQLNKEHDSSCSVRIIPILTGAETDLQEGRIVLKASVAAQYMVYDRIMVETVTDAYSTIRDVTVEKDKLQLMTRLDSMEKTVETETSSALHFQRILDICCCHSHPSTRQNGDALECELTCTYQILSMDESGNLQGHTLRADSQFRIPSDSDNAICLYPGVPSSVELFQEGDGIRVKSGMQLLCDTYCSSGMEMVSGFNISEAREADPARPSIILRQVGDEGLWNLAKHCRSSVKAIQDANHLQAEPQAGQILLVPVL